MEQKQTCSVHYMIPTKCGAQIGISNGDQGMEIVFQTGHTMA